MREYVKITKSEFELMPKEVNHQALVFIELDDCVLIDFAIMSLPYYSWVHQYLDGKEVIMYNMEIET